MLSRNADPWQVQAGAGALPRARLSSPVSCHSGWPVAGRPSSWGTENHPIVESGLQNRNLFQILTLHCPLPIQKPLKATSGA